MREFFREGTYKATDDDSADSLFICSQIDREVGGGHCEEAKVAVSFPLQVRWNDLTATIVRRRGPKGGGKSLEAGHISHHSVY